MRDKSHSPCSVIFSLSEVNLKLQMSEWHNLSEDLFKWLFLPPLLQAQCRNIHVRDFLENCSNSHRWSLQTHILAPNKAFLFLEMHSSHDGVTSASKSYFTGHMVTWLLFDEDNVMCSKDEWVDHSYCGLNLSTSLTCVTLCGLQVNEETVERLVVQYPHIVFSTVMQDCKRTLERAYQMGWSPNTSNAS